MLKRRRTRSSRRAKTTNEPINGMEIEGDDEEDKEEEEEDSVASFQEIPFEYEIVNRSMYHPSVFRK